MTISVGGLVSGLDTNSIVTQLMDLEKQPITKLQTQQAAYNVQLTTYGSLKDTLSQLKTDTDNISTVANLTGFSASSGDSSLFTATADSSAAAGSYDITVQQLAASHKLTSSSFLKEDLVGEGTLHLKVGTGDAIDISVSATDTIADVAKSITDAKAGVKAAALFDGTNYFLTLTAEETGSANVINLTATDSDTNNTDTNGLSRLVYDQGVTTNLTNTRDAADAIITVDGVTDIHRATNVMDDVIEGVTLNLLSAPDAPGNQASLSITKNTSSMVSKINSFVTSYNQFLTYLQTAQGYNSETKVAGSLMGDATTNSIRTNLKSLLSNKVLGNDSFSRLADLGISMNAKGKLEVNSTTLNNAISEHSDDVIQFFTQTTSGSEGFAVRMAKSLDAMIGTDGTIAARTKGIQSTIDGIDKKVSRLETQNTAFETRIRNQFNSLELLLSQFKTTGDYLTQQITGMQNTNTAIANQ
jgi:flagellar hook-associated protein 2